MIVTIFMKGDRTREVFRYTLLLVKFLQKFSLQDCSVLLGRSYLSVNVASGLFGRQQIPFSSCVSYWRNLLHSRGSVHSFFIDFNNAFVTDDRNLCWELLGHYDCSDIFVKIIREFHEGMQASVLV